MNIIVQVSVLQIRHLSTGLSKMLVFVLINTQRTSPFESGMTWTTLPNNHEPRGAE